MCVALKICLELSVIVIAPIKWSGALHESVPYLKTSPACFYGWCWLQEDHSPSHSAEAPLRAVPGGKGIWSWTGNPRPRKGPAADQWPEHPSPRYPGSSWARCWGSTRGPQSAPFSISLSFLICRERRTDPERADPGGGAVLKVQNLLDASFPGLGTLSLLGGWAPCREAISAGGLSSITSPEKLPARWGPLGNSVTKPACMGSRKCSPAGAFRVRTRVAENVLRGSSGARTSAYGNWQHRDPVWISGSLFILSYAAGSGVDALHFLSHLPWHLTAPRVVEMGRSHISLKPKSCWTEWVGSQRRAHQLPKVVCAQRDRVCVCGGVSAGPCQWWAENPGPPQRVSAHWPGMGSNHARSVFWSWKIHLRDNSRVYPFPPPHCLPSVP